jgi:hypothetical protein
MTTNPVESQLLRTKWVGTSDDMRLCKLKSQGKDPQEHPKDDANDRQDERPPQREPNPMVNMYKRAKTRHVTVVVQWMMMLLSM